MDTHAPPLWLRRPGAWFAAAIAFGALTRLYFSLFTEGTYDVDVWGHHARFLNQLGMIEYYREVQLFNHPPLIGILLSKVWTCCQSTGLPFAIALRVPFALLDLATAWLLGELFRDGPWRFFVIAAYWMNPLAMLISAYHGNTDSSIAFFILATIVLAARDRPILAGAIFGLGLGIKLPILLSAPAFFLFFKTWRRKTRFLFAVAIVALAAYSPLLFREPLLLKRNILDYPGSMVFTNTGIYVWGLFNFEWLDRYLPSVLIRPFQYLLYANWFHNKRTVIALILFHAWCQRRATTTRELGQSLAGTYMILYGVTAYWAPQYVAWSIPFWYCVGWRFASMTTLMLTVYLYGMYMFVCGNPWMLGKWDFLGRPEWPAWLVVTRDVTNLYCLALAIGFLSKDIIELIRQRQIKRALSTEPPAKRESA